MNGPVQSFQAFCSQAFLQAAFRPFYLLGSLFGIYLLAHTALYLLGIAPLNTSNLSFALWHGHELVFGFAGAIVLGFMLTALPSWAGARELDSWKLLLLIIIWLLGRLAFITELSLTLLAVIDSSLFILATLFVARDLWLARNRWFLVVFLIFSGFWIGNISFYISLMQMDFSSASQSIKIALYAIIFKFVMVGGFLTVTFSNNVMEERNQPLIKFSRPLEACAITSIVLLFITHILQLNQFLIITASLFAFAVHLLRLINMRGWTMLDHPLLLMMNIAYAWMVISFLLKAFHEFGFIGEDIWLHAFTVGAMGIMMMSLMTRVALRHTGRPLQVAGLRKTVFWVVIFATMLRLLSGLLPASFLPLSALIFCTAFIIYLWLYGRMLWQQSLPKKSRKKNSLKPLLT